MEVDNTIPGASFEIVLVRHGRSAHVQRGWLDLHAFHRWREAYEAAGLYAGEMAPPELRAVAMRAGAVVASDALRAVESARLLVPTRVALMSPLLRELELAPPAVQRLRLPLAGWALAFGVRWLYRTLLSLPQVSADERARALEAARWLQELARQHGSVVAVTHHGFRGLLAGTLAEAGWQSARTPKRWHHWSAWTFSRTASGPDTGGAHET